MKILDPTRPVNLQSRLNRNKKLWFRGIPNSTGPKDLIKHASFAWQGTLRWGGSSHKGSHRSVLFDGATNSMCSTVVKPPIAGKGLTMGIWFKTTQQYVSGSHGLLGWNNSSLGTSGTYDRTLYLGTAGTLTQRPVFFAGGDLIADIVLNDGYWHFVVGTIAANGAATIYVDGRSYGTGSFSLYDGWTAPSLCVGRTAGSVRGSNPFNGSMDDWFYAEGEYSNGEVCALYNATRKNNPDLWNWLQSANVEAGTASGTTYNESGSGGISFAGTVPPKGTYTLAGSGGLLLNGTAVEKWTYRPSTSGSLILNGASTVKETCNISGSGGLALDGTMTPQVSYSMTGGGGIMLSGDTLLQTDYNLIGDGGLLLAGVGDVSQSTFESGTGSLVLSGVSPIQCVFDIHGVESGPGGIVICEAAGGVLAEISFVYNTSSSGTITFTGTTPAQTTYNTLGSGELILSGSVESQGLFTEIGDGGVILSGSATLDTSFVPAPYYYLLLREF